MELGNIKASTIVSRTIGNTKPSVKRDAQLKNVTAKSPSSSSSILTSKSASTAQRSISNTNEYNCHSCNFTTTRLNLIILHDKTHGAKKVVQTPESSQKCQSKTPKATIISGQSRILSGSDSEREIEHEKENTGKQINLKIQKKILI